MILNMDVIFVLRKKQRKKRINITVYCRVTTNGPRAEFSTGISIKTEQVWDHSRGEFFDFCVLGRVYNKKLNVIRAELEAIQLNLHVQRLPFGPHTIINIYRGDAVPKTTFLRACDEYMKEREDLYKKGEIKEGTVIKDRLYVTHITDFLTETKRYPLLPQEFKIKLALEFKTWLNTSKSNTARHLEFYSRVLDSCVVNEYLEANPLLSMKMGRDRIKKKVFLEKEEVEKMLQTKLEVPILQHTAHLYLYQCGNGFSYADLYSDKYKIVTRDQEQVFAGDREKGAQPYFVPMFSLSQAILQIYDGKLPYIDNRTYNRCLKQIAPMLGIDKHLTTHTARKTFATLKHNEGWSLPAISVMLGHTSTRTTELYYIQKDEKVVLSELRRMGGAA